MIMLGCWVPRKRSMFGHIDPTSAAPASGWVPWPRGRRTAAVSWWNSNTACADVTFCVPEDSGASLMSFPTPRSFLSLSVSTRNYHIPGHVTAWQSLGVLLYFACDRALRCQSSNQRHGHTGKKEEYFLASSALWHTHHLLYLPGWAGGCNSPTTFSTTASIQPCSSPPPIFQGFSSLPHKEEFSFSYFPKLDFFFLVHSQSALASHASFKDHSAGRLLHGIQTFTKVCLFALLLQTWESPLACFLGSLVLLPAWG